MIDTTFSRLFADTSIRQNLIDQLQRGGILAFPTDTLYGLAVDATSEKGVEAVYRLKGRDDRKPLILFLADLETLSTLSLPVSSVHEHLLRLHWPGALTAVFPFGGDQRLSAFRFPSLGVRIPDHHELRCFLRDYPGLLLTTSANRSNTAPLGSPDEIRQEFGSELAGLIDGGPLPDGIPSTVADFSRIPPRILRQGKIRL